MFSEKKGLVFQFLYPSEDARQTDQLSGIQTESPELFMPI